MDPFKSDLNLKKIQLPKCQTLVKNIIGRVLDEWCCYFDRRQERSPLFDNLPECQMVELLHDFVVGMLFEGSQPLVASPMNVSIGVWVFEALRYMIGTEIDDAENMDCSVTIDYSRDEVQNYSKRKRNFRIKKLNESPHFSEEDKRKFTKILEEGIDEEECRIVESKIDSALDIERTKNLKKRRKFLTKSKGKVEMMSSENEPIFDKFMKGKKSKKLPTREEAVEDLLLLMESFRIFHNEFVIPDYVQLNRDDDGIFESNFVWRRMAIEAFNEVVSHAIGANYQHNSDLNGFLKVIKDMFGRNSGEFIHISHIYQFSETFWDDLIIRCGFSISFYTQKEEIYGMFTRMYGSLDHKKDENRYTSIHSMLVKSVEEYSQTFDYNETKRKLFRLQVYFSRVSNFYPRETNKIYRFAKEIVEKGLDEKSKDSEEWNLMKRTLEDESIFSLRMDGALNWMIRMIRSRSDFDVAEERIKSVDAMGDEEITTFERIFPTDGLDEEFRKRFFENRAFYCSNCYKMEDLRKKMKVCSGCKINRYCTTICQRADWRKHRKDCRVFQKMRKMGK